MIDVRERFREFRQSDAFARIGLLLALMISFATLVMTMASVTVALPTLRSVFRLDADFTSWIVTGYVLPYIAFIPLFGRLGDRIGKRRLLVTGLFVFVAATGIAFLAPSIGVLMLSRVLQGVGAAAVNPLAISIITAAFPRGRQGKMLTTWNVTGPVTGAVAPLIAGFLLEHVRWNVIFLIPLALGSLSIVLLLRFVPASDRSTRASSELRRFDWLGFVLLVLAVGFFVCYLSSRPITGVPPLRDMRLLLPAVVSFGLLVLRERQCRNPFLSLSLLRDRRFTIASLTVSVRMFLLAGLNLLVPLYLSDVYGLDPGQTGIVVTLNAAALAITMRAGGRVVDRAEHHWPVFMGLTVQGGMMVALGFVPPSGVLPLVMAYVGVHGLAAGFSLGAMHKFAMGAIPERELGAAAGLYSFIRFSGVVVSTALGGVILQAGIDQDLPFHLAYRNAFLMYAAIGLLGALLSLFLREERPVPLNGGR